MACAFALRNVGLSTYSTDEERVEAIRRWWHANGAAVIVGLLLGISALVGWKLWTDYRQARAENASQIYMAMVQATTQEQAERAEGYARQLLEEYRNTPYAASAAFELARQAVVNDDLPVAQAHLNWVLAQAKRPDTQQIARLRLARVLIASGDGTQALSVLSSDFDRGFSALVEELRGDAYRQLGQLEQARAAYDRAIAAHFGIADFVQMKRDALHLASSTTDAASPVEAESSAPAESPAPALPAETSAADVNDPNPVITE